MKHVWIEWPELPIRTGEVPPPKWMLDYLGFKAVPAGAISDSDSPAKLNSIPENTAKYPDSEQTSDSDAP